MKSLAMLAAAALLVGLAAFGVACKNGGGGGLSLEESITLYEQGMELAKRCQAILDGAEQRITKLRESFGQPPVAEEAVEEEELLVEEEALEQEAFPMEEE